MWRYERARLLSAFGAAFGRGAEVESAFTAETATVALSSSLGCTRVLLASEESPTVAARVVIGSTAVAALAVLCLGLFGVIGLGALFASCLLGLVMVKS